MNIAGIFGLVAAVAWSAGAWAEGANQSVEKLRQKGYSVTSVTPIFSQLLKISHPKEFSIAPAFEKTNGGFYIREAVLPGETVDNWTQMITATGNKDLASKPGTAPKAVLDVVAEGFKRACPNSYAAQILNEDKVSGFDAVAAVLSCGASPTTSGKTSETTLFVVIKGQNDFYQVQWAERTAPSNTPMRIDVWKWRDRLRALNPIKLCPIIAGEKPPYPSCA